MNKINLILLCLSLFYNSYGQRLIDLENDDSTSNSLDELRYNRDNTIYTSHREFIFDYYILEGKDTLKCRFSKKEYGIPEWVLVAQTDTHRFTVQKVGIQILPCYLNNNQTGCRFNYYNGVGKFVSNNNFTGIIENHKNVWLHPPREQFFGITQFNSFPFIKMPLAIGKKWRSCLTIGYFDSYQRFNLYWKGVLNSTEELEITAQTELETALGKLNCWVVSANSKSDLTASISTFYFNEVYGFVKIDYVLFDKRRLVFDLIKVKNF